MDQWLALVTFSIQSSGSPGPNNVLLWASGAAFGFMPTMPHIVGTVLGIGALPLIAAARLAAVLSSVPRPWRLSGVEPVRSESARKQGSHRSFRLTRGARIPPSPTNGVRTVDEQHYLRGQVDVFHARLDEELVNESLPSAQMRQRGL